MSVERQLAFRFLFDIGEAELSVVEHRYLDGQLMLNRGHQIAEQHPDPAIARERDDLAAGRGLLQAERGRHGRRHGSEQEAGEEAPFGGGGEIAVHSDGSRSVISRNEGIVSRHPVDDDEGIAEMGARFLVQPRDQCFESRLDVANQSSGHRMAAAQMGRFDVDLHDLRVVRIELPPGKIRAEQQQGVALPNGVIGRLVPDEPSHADVMRIVVFEGVLAPGSVADRRLEDLGHTNNLVMRASTT
jgi:hypothetical protein